MLLNQIWGHLMDLDNSSIRRDFKTFLGATLASMMMFLFWAFVIMTCNPEILLVSAAITFAGFVAASCVTAITWGRLMETINEEEMIEIFFDDDDDDDWLCLG